MAKRRDDFVWIELKAGAPAAVRINTRRLQLVLKQGEKAEILKLDWTHLVEPIGHFRLTSPPGIEPASKTEKRKKER